eukprot:GILK01022147.1.p1 GENE.GILK01022147.1~~GILK01022147.1.p1  ORF type:complete len:239 (+),score=19.04 GILK01022147.1:102-818(+)
MILTHCPILSVLGTLIYIWNTLLVHLPSQLSLEVAAMKIPEGKYQDVAELVALRLIAKSWRSLFEFDLSHSGVGCLLLGSNSVNVTPSPTGSVWYTLPTFVLGDDVEIVTNRLLKETYGMNMRDCFGADAIVLRLLNADKEVHVYRIQLKLGNKMVDGDLENIVTDMTARSGTVVTMLDVAGYRISRTTNVLITTRQAKPQAVEDATSKFPDFMFIGAKELKEKVWPPGIKDLGKPYR